MLTCFVRSTFRLFFVLLIAMNNVLIVRQMAQSLVGKVALITGNNGHIVFCE